MHPVLPGASPLFTVYLHKIKVRESLREDLAEQQAQAETDVEELLGGVFKLLQLEFVPFGMAVSEQYFEHFLNIF